jgi:DNA-binding XRE family transcriptional regulator
LLFPGRRGEIGYEKIQSEKASPRTISAVDIYIGARMRERRLALNLSQAGLGEVLGVSFQQVQKYEGGKNRVSAARLFDICRILNLSLSSMFERNPQA